MGFLIDVIFGGDFLLFWSVVFTIIFVLWLLFVATNLHYLPGVNKLTALWFIVGMAFWLLYLLKSVAVSYYEQLLNNDIALATISVALVIVFVYIITSGQGEKIGRTIKKKIKGKKKR